MLADFQIIMLFSENCLVVSDAFQEECIVFSRDDVLREFAYEITRESYGILGIFFQKREVYLGFTRDITIQVGTGCELDKILVAVEVFREEYETVDFRITSVVFLALFTDEYLDADDRFDTFLFTQEIEFKCSVEIIGIGDGECWHSEFFRSHDKCLRIAEALEE
jgi:hypothetical protein